MRLHKLHNIRLSLLVLGLAVVMTSLYSCGNDNDDIPEPKPENNPTVKLSCPDSNHPHAIDLGLPSGLKWACCNVGAKNRSDCGYYFAWGETYEKSYYEWDNYLWCDYIQYMQSIHYPHLTKYCCDWGDGIKDDIQTLLPEDDVATQEWKGRWRMPTLDEQDELVMNCKWKKAIMSGQEGCMIVGPNNNTIFLPLTGVKELSCYDRECCYWSSTLGNSFSAYGMHFTYDEVLKRTTTFPRCNGMCVRPVRP